MLVPCLESNNKWLKKGIRDYFKRKGAKVVLADHGAGSVRQHSILKYFKKYATQSPLQMFKKRQRKEWKVVLEYTIYRQKDVTLPKCVENERWTDHDISGFLDNSIKLMMTRNGRYNMLVRHYDSTVSIESDLTSDIHCTVQRAMDGGCKVEDVIRKLDEEKAVLIAEKGMLMVSDNMFSQRFNTVISF